MDGPAVHNANVITMNPLQPRAGAMAVRGGRIAAVGSWEDVAHHAEGLPLLDLGGRTVLPGLIDTHAHFLWTALSLAALDVGEARDHGALQDVVRRAVEGQPPGELIYGMGFTEYALDTARFSPIVDALDAVAPDNPVFLMGITGHTSAANSRALEILGLLDGTPGVMRDAAGRPNGLLAGRTACWRTRRTIWRTRDSGSPLVRPKGLPRGWMRRRGKPFPWALPPCTPWKAMTLATTGPS
jgi:predicted amidohydrolase YtcJ